MTTTEEETDTTWTQEQIVAAYEHQIAQLLDELQRTHAHIAHLTDIIETGPQ